MIRLETVLESGFPMSCTQASETDPPPPPLCKGGSKRVAPAAHSLPPLQRGGWGGSAHWLSHVRNPCVNRFWLVRILSCVLWLPPSLAFGAGPPEIVRIRVPSDNVLKCFPPGTELRGLSFEQFEALVASAREGYERQADLRPPRLLRVRHFARWEPAAGLLSGSSELVVEPSPSGPGALVLNPWTPAIEPGATVAAGRGGGGRPDGDPGRGDRAVDRRRSLAAPGAAGLAGVRVYARPPRDRDGPPGP